MSQPGGTGHGGKAKVEGVAGVPPCLRQAKALERRWAGPSGGMSGSGHMGLLGRDTAETLGTVPSEGVRREHEWWQGEERRSERSPRGHRV